MAAQKVAATGAGCGGVAYYKFNVYICRESINQIN